MKFRILKEANEPLEDIKYDLDVEQDFEGPDLGVETGVSGLLLDQIAKVAQNINDYNMMRANLERYPEIDELIQSLADQENETLGKLQSALKSISPNAELIMNGAVEAEADFPLDENYRTEHEADLYISNMQSDIAKILKDSGGDLDNFNGKIIGSEYQQPKLLLSFNSTLFKGVDEKTFKAKAEEGLEKYLSTTKFYDVSYVSFIKADVPVPGIKSYDIEIRAYADSDDLD